MLWRLCVCLPIKLYFSSSVVVVHRRSRKCGVFKVIIRIQLYSANPKSAVRCPPLLHGHTTPTRNIIRVTHRRRRPNSFIRRIHPNNSTCVCRGNGEISVTDKNHIRKVSIVEFQSSVLASLSILIKQKQQKLIFGYTRASYVFRFSMLPPGSAFAIISPLLALIKRRKNNRISI